MAEFFVEVSKWVLYFFSYSILGWIFESTYCSLKERPIRFINRGFLFGPLCPIYGSGLTAVILIMQPFKHFGLVEEFLVTVLVCSVIEYLASFLMEKIYHVRWWSYKNSKYNITLNGRISLMTSLGFGIGGILVLHLVQPILEKLVGSVNPETRTILSVGLILIFLVDNYLSSMAAVSLKHALTGGKVDLTEEIKRYAFNYYRKQTRRTRKLAKKILRTMRLAQKRALKQLRGTQRRIMKHAEKIEYLTKKLEILKEIAKNTIETIPYKTEKMKKNIRSDLRVETKKTSDKKKNNRKRD